MHQHLNQADVVIADNGGSFDNRYSSTRNPCVGRKAPTRVIAARTAQAVTAMLQMVGYDPELTLTVLCLVAAQRPKPDITGERTVAAETTLPIPWSGSGFSRFLPDDLPWEIRRGDATPADPAPFHLPPNGIDLTALDAELIRQALGMAAGNKSRAARLLGLTRDTLLYRMEKHLIKA